MNIGAIIQARTSSTRLPNKILLPLPFGGKITVLEQVIERVKKSKRIEEIIVATTYDIADKKIINIAKKAKVKWYQGNKNNVLERYYFAAKKNRLDIIVRITSDCPCIDPKIIDQTIKKHLNLKSDYTSNALLKTFPRGLDTEVLNVNTLEKAYYKATKEYEKEHVTPYIYQHPKLFKIANLYATNKCFPNNIRITLDTLEDYTLLCFLYDYLYPKNHFFNSKDIINLFKKKPWLYLINQKIIQKTIPSINYHEEK